MKNSYIFLILLFCSCTNNKKFDGYVYDYATEKPIQNVFVDVNGNTRRTDSTGYFCVKLKPNLPSIIYFKKEGYFSKKIYRKPDSLGRYSKGKIHWNRIYLYNKESEF
jgi:hypothetical protein